VSRDADLPIIDAHHHFWDLARKAHPWLRDEPMIPFRYGDYSAIRRDFLPADYRALAHGHNVVSTVTMEGEWDEGDLVAESRWITGLAQETGLPAAHVSRTILHEDGAADELARHAAYPIVRGIRHKPTYAPGPGLVERGTPGGLSDPRWLRGYAALAPSKLHFELQAPWWHVDEMLDLIAAYPDTPIVINHAFMPVDRSADGLKGWRAAIKRAASAPQASMKISGIGIKGQPWRLEDQRPIIDGLIDAFGIGRCMFASNFPVDSLVGSFDAIYAGFKEGTADLTRADRIKLFHDNAIRIYRLDIPPQSA
jgi:predicted TIM-barrel fold metal-dependent hydrolase